jgi:hypothetical protein
MSGLPESGRPSAILRCRTSAISDLTRRSKIPSFDHPVGTQQKQRRNGYAYRLRGFQVDHEKELGWLSRLASIRRERVLSRWYLNIK